MVKKFLVIILSMSALCAAQSIPQELKDAVQQRSDAVQAVGDLLIKNGALSPWLEQMRDTQKELNSNNGAMRDYEFQQVNDDYQSCKIRKSSNPAQKSPLEQKADALDNQKKDLIKKIIKDKSTNIEALVQLDIQAEQLFENYMTETGNQLDQQMVAAEPQISQENLNVIKKLEALQEVLGTFLYASGELPPAIKDFLQSNDVQKYWDILHTDINNCLSFPVNLFMNMTHGEYDTLIRNLVYEGRSKTQTKAGGA